MNVASQTNVGRRISNEDSFLVPSEGDELTVIAVADGMGGHAAGKRASTLAVEGLSSLLLSAREPAEDPMQRLRLAVRQINQDIYHHASTEQGCRGMGTTLTLALLFPDQYIAANVGDSRLYHYDGWNLSQVTHDHSLVAVLVAAGEITLAESYIHPQRNIITRALGTADYEEADYFQRRWVEGDILLLCTDGLHGCLKDEAMEAMLREERTLQQHCDELVKAALEAGATDNITVVLAQHTGGDSV